MLNRTTLLRGASLFLISTLALIMLLVISVALELLLTEFVDIFILPRGYFKWSVSLETRLYVVYLVAFIFQIIISYKLLKKNKQSKFLCFIILYFLWLSLPTYTHWHIEGGADYGGHPDAPIGIVVPNVLALERAFIFISSDTRHPVSKAMSKDFYYIYTSAFLYVVLIGTYRKRKSSILCKENILSRGALISGFIAWISIVVIFSSFTKEVFFGAIRVIGYIYSMF